MRRPRSLAYLRLALTVTGLAVAGYLTLLHYDSDVPMVCGQGSFVDCHTVLASPSSVVLGLPVALWGLGWFAVALGLAVPALGRGWSGALEGFDEDDPARAWDAGEGSPTGAETLHVTRLAWSLVGVGTVLWLVYQEVGVIGKLCAWCTAVHAIVFALFAVEVVTYRRPPSAGPVVA